MASWIAPAHQRCLTPIPANARPEAQCSVSIDALSSSSEDLPKIPKTSSGERQSLGLKALAYSFRNGRSDVSQGTVLASAVKQLL